MTQQIKQKVDVVPYDAVWDIRFEMEEERLRKLLGDLIVNVHHVGSTSIPGIYAIPIVDMLVEVKEISKVDEYNSGMRQLGYMVKGEHGVPGRRLYYKGTPTSVTHHIHIYEVGDVQVGRLVNFRDYMKLYPDAAIEYSNLKVSLAKQYPYDIEAYTYEKERFIRNLEMKINVWKKFIEKDLL